MSSDRQKFGNFKMIDAAKRLVDACHQGHAISESNIPFQPTQIMADLHGRWTTIIQCSGGCSLGVYDPKTGESFSFAYQFRDGASDRMEFLSGPDTPRAEALFVIWAQEAADAATKHCFAWLAAATDEAAPPTGFQN